MLAELREKKTSKPIFTKFDGKVAHGAGKKLLDFGNNFDHVVLGLRLGRVKVR